MKLWLLRGIDDEPNKHDKVQGFVIRAENEASARELATTNAGDETIKNPEFWRAGRFSSCSELHSHGEPCVVLCDYLHG